MAQQPITAVLRKLVTQPQTAPLCDQVTLIDHAQEAVFEGKSTVTSILTTFFHDSFQGECTINNLIANESAAALTITVNGRHHNHFMGIPPTGRVVTLPLALICRLTQDQVCHIALFYDAGSLLRQLGLA